MTSTEKEAVEVDKEEHVTVEVNLAGINIGKNLICQLTAENARTKVRGSKRVPILILDIR